MGTVTTKIGNVFKYIRNSYERLGEYDVDEIELNDYSGKDISQKDIAYLKKAMAEVESMEKSYNNNKKQKRNNAVTNVSNSKTVSEIAPQKARTKTEVEKDRED